MDYKSRLEALLETILNTGRSLWHWVKKRRTKH